MNGPPANITVHRMMRYIGSTMLFDPHGHSVSYLLIGRCLQRNNSDSARSCSDNSGLQELWSHSVCLMAALPTPASAATVPICAGITGHTVLAEGRRGSQRHEQRMPGRCTDRRVSYRRAAFRGRSGAPGCGGTDFVAHCRPQRLGAPAHAIQRSACEPTPRMYSTHAADHTAVADSRDRQQQRVGRCR